MIVIALSQTLEFPPSSLLCTLRLCAQWCMYVCVYPRHTLHCTWSSDWLDEIC